MNLKTYIERLEGEGLTVRHVINYVDTTSKWQRFNVFQGGRYVTDLLAFDREVSGLETFWAFPLNDVDAEMRAVVKMAGRALDAERAG